jgi:hypothetical protein
MVVCGNVNPFPSKASMREDFDAARVVEDAKELGLQDGEGSDDRGNEAVEEAFGSQQPREKDMLGQAFKHLLHALTLDQSIYCGVEFDNFGFFFCNWFHVLF